VVADVTRIDVVPREVDHEVDVAEALDHSPDRRIDSLLFGRLDLLEVDQDVLKHGIERGRRGRIETSLKGRRWWQPLGRRVNLDALQPLDQLESQFKTVDGVVYARWPTGRFPRSQLSRDFTVRVATEESSVLPTLQTEVESASKRRFRWANKVLTPPGFTPRP
jgi:hypothetical protein